MHIIGLFASIASTHVVAHFMDMDWVGVPVCALVFTFSSQLHFGWHPHLDGRLQSCLCLCGGVCGCISGCCGCGIDGCGHNMGGGVVRMGN